MTKKVLGIRNQDHEKRGVQPDPPVRTWDLIESPNTASTTTVSSHPTVSIPSVWIPATPPDAAPSSQPTPGVTPPMASSPDPIEAVDRDERADDESISEWDQRLLTANQKARFDMFTAADYDAKRMFTNEYIRGLRRQEEADAEARGQRLRQQEELHAQYLRHTEELFTERMRGQQQATAHRDLAIGQQWRDQARDSGESVFAPAQSS